MQIQKCLKNPIAVAVIIGFLTLILLVVTAPDIGMTWDEPAYIAAARSYKGWFDELIRNPWDAFSQEVIDPYWEINHEHPPIDKVWSGLVWAAARNFFPDLVAHRLGNMILVSVMVAFLYYWVERQYGTLASLISIAALLGLPRFFFHAHLAALDVPASFAVFIMTALFMQTEENKSWKWTIFLGLVFGVAFGTKLNAFFVLPTLGLWLLIFRRRWYLFTRLAVSSVIGVVISLILWPWIYPEPFARIDEYIRFITVDHWEIGQWYLGRFYIRCPVPSAFQEPYYFPP